MARYIKQSPRQVQSMYNPIDIGFYAGILNSAQQNLNEASKIQAAYEDDIYNIKTFDPTTKEAYIKKAQEAIGNELDKDFVSPANVAKGVARASKILAPFKNVNEKQLELAKRMQEQQDRWGSDWIGGDITKMSLTNPTTGELITPTELSLKSGNRQDLVKAILADNAGLSEMVREKPGTWKTILNGQAYEVKDAKIKGLTEEERIAKFVKFADNNPNLVQQYMQQMPGFAEAVKASGMNPEEYIARELDTVSRQFVKGIEYDRSHIANQDYVSSSATYPSIVTPDAISTFNGIKTNDIKKKESRLSSIKNGIDGVYTPPKQDKTYMPQGTNGLPSEVMYAQRSTGYTPSTTEMFNRNEKEFQELTKDKAGLWRRVWGKHGFPGYDKIDKYKEAQKEFISQLEVLEKEGLGTVTGYHPNSNGFDKTMANALMIGLSTTGRKVDGKKSDVLFKGGTGDVKIMPRNDGNITMIKNGTAYDIEVFESDGETPTGVLDSESSAVLKFQKNLYDGMFDFSDENYKKPLTLGKAVMFPTDDGKNVGVIPVYKYVQSFIEDEKGKEIPINKLVVSYYDISTQKPYLLENGSYEKETDLRNVSYENAEILKSINPKPEE